MKSSNTKPATIGKKIKATISAIKIPSMLRPGEKLRGVKILSSFEPSKGGTGIKLKSAKIIFI